MNSPDRRRPLSGRDVLVVDDEEDIRELVELSLLRMGLGCDTAATLGEARARLAQRDYRLCLTDMRLPDGDGLELVADIQQHHAGLPVAVITAYGSIDTAIRALKLGAFDFVTKPLERTALRELVQHALSPSPDAEAVGKEAAGGDGQRRLIGVSPAIERLRGQIAKLARSQAPVFIQGESGTGKEVIARLIHASGPRADAPFVPVNCGAIATELMESEFFGHVKGSFTGAVSDKPGLFQAARGGTLFLDEIAELPLPMQVKLLRAIQERAVRPVGAQEEVAVDVRILSASHRDLAQRVADGLFRQDLFFRINVIALPVPPLRERPDDIPELARHILARLTARDGVDWRLSDAALQALARHPFPGNVRELENLLERACALCDGSEIGAADLSTDPVDALAPTPPPATPLTEASSAPGTRPDERLQVLHTLEQTRWNRSEAARRLGMTLRQLRYRLGKWGLE